MNIVSESHAASIKYPNLTKEFLNTYLRAPFFKNKFKLEFVLL